ncbi:MAG: hypothetical protein ABEJ56_00905 [Candidatus Nanohaloarchaea archaeon]
MVDEDQNQVFDTLAKRVQYGGDIEHEIDPDHREEIESDKEQGTAGVMEDPGTLRKMSSSYHLLFHEGVFEILRRRKDGDIKLKFDPGEMGELDETETGELMEYHGLEDDLGTSIYQKWEAIEAFLGSRRRYE